jgi:hypothetical protein
MVALRFLLGLSLSLEALMEFDLNGSAIHFLSSPAWKAQLLEGHCLIISPARFWIWNQVAPLVLFMVAILLQSPEGFRIEWYP